jgi:hypothetical protein
MRHSLFALAALARAVYGLPGGYRNGRDHGYGGYQNNNDNNGYGGHQNNDNSDYGGYQNNDNNGAGKFYILSSFHLIIPNF